MISTCTIVVFCPLTRLVKIAEQYLMTVAGCTYVENHEDAYELSEAEGDTEFERCES